MGYDLNLFPQSLNPNVADIKLELLTPACNDVSIPVIQANELVNQKGFDASQRTIIYAKGFFEPFSTNALAKAFRCRNDTNFVASNYINFFL